MNGSMTTDNLNSEREKLDVAFRMYDLVVQRFPDLSKERSVMDPFRSFLNTLMQPLWMQANGMVMEHGSGSLMFLDTRIYITGSAGQGIVDRVQGSDEIWASSLELSVTKPEIIEEFNMLHAEFINTKIKDKQKVVDVEIVMQDLCVPEVGSGLSREYLIEYLSTAGTGINISKLVIGNIIISGEEQLDTRSGKIDSTVRDCGVSNDPPTISEDLARVEKKWLEGFIAGKLNGIKKLIIQELDTRYLGMLTEVIKNDGLNLKSIEIVATYNRGEIKGDDIMSLIYALEKSENVEDFSINLNGNKTRDRMLHGITKKAPDARVLFHHSNNDDKKFYTSRNSRGREVKLRDDFNHLFTNMSATKLDNVKEGKCRIDEEIEEMEKQYPFEAWNKNPEYLKDLSLSPYQKEAIQRHEMERRNRAIEGRSGFMRNIDPERSQHATKVEREEVMKEEILSFPLLKEYRGDRSLEKIDDFMSNINCDRLKEESGCEYKFLRACIKHQIEKEAPDTKLDEARAEGVIIGSGRLFNIK